MHKTSVELAADILATMYTYNSSLEKTFGAQQVSSSEPVTADQVAADLKTIVKAVNDCYTR